MWWRGSGRGYKVGNADITIIAQRPKMRPYIDSMRKMWPRGSGCGHRQSRHQGHDNGRTGIHGRAEGIAAQASVLMVSAIS